MGSFYVSLCKVQLLFSGCVVLKSGALFYFVDCGGNDTFSLWSQVAEAEEKTAGGLLLTEASKEKPSVGTVSDG